MQIQKRYEIVRMHMASLDSVVGEAIVHLSWPLINKLDAGQ